MSQVTITRGSSLDIDAVMEVMRAAFDPIYGEGWNAAQLLGVLAMPGAALFLARKRRPLLGFALQHRVVDQAELMLLAVDPRARRIGIGGVLLGAVVNDARCNSATTLHLEVRSTNPAAAMYKHAGFVQCGTRQGYYRGLHGEMYDAITLAMRIRTKG